VLLKRPHVLVHYPVIAALDGSVEKCRSADEDGGILLGCYRGPHLEITDFTRSAPGDERGRHSFVRQDSAHQAAATKAWRKSKETTTFIGEWHTHPYGAPEPSGIDTNSWFELVKNADNAMVFAVVAPERWALYLARPSIFGPREKRMFRNSEGELGAVFETKKPRQADI
jgi:integrative and conjugative element protein (TIGR02256 family)